MTPPPPAYPPNSNGPGFPGVLSDEEMRERAAAYAQMIFEQQLAAYKAQREQAIAAQEEFARQWQAYQQTLKQYYERQQTSGQAVLQIDPDTGAQTFSEGESEVSAFVSSPSPSEEDAEAGLSFQKSLAPEFGGFYGGGGFLQGRETTSYEQDGTDEVSVSVFPQDDADEGVPAADAADSRKMAEPPERFAQEIPPQSFPWLSAVALAVITACIASVGYILYADDPRFESERNDLVSFFEKLADGFRQGLGAEKVEAPERVVAEESVMSEPEASSSEKESVADEEEALGD